MSSVFYRFEHSSPAVRGRKTCNSRTFVFFLRADFGKCEHALHLFELAVFRVSKPTKDITLSPPDRLKEFLQFLWNRFSQKGKHKN